MVDADTGHVRVREFYAVDDAGRIINPMVVKGQVHGAIAQGIGQALFENCTYDPESGQLLAGSYMDYAMPRRSEEHTSELQSLMRISYAVFCLNKTKQNNKT